MLSWARRFLTAPFRWRPVLRVRGWFGQRHRKLVCLVSLVFFSLLLIGADWYQQWTIGQYFEPLYGDSGSAEEYALKCNAHIHQIHRLYVKHLAEIQQKDAMNLAYELPIGILHRGGACVHRSLLLCVALHVQGIPARKLLIGVNDRFAAHVVVEAYLNGDWRVFDPLFGYVFRRPDGQLATAADLKQHPELLEQVVKADKDPFPHPYPVNDYFYSRTMHFNWYKGSVLKPLRTLLGPAADDWVPPFVSNWRLTVLAYSLLLISGLGTIVSLSRARKRKARLEAGKARLGVHDSQPVTPGHPAGFSGGRVAEHGLVCGDASAGVAGQADPGNARLSTFPPPHESPLWKAPSPGT